MKVNSLLLISTIALVGAFTSYNGVAETSVKANIDRNANVTVDDFSFFLRKFFTDPAFQLSHVQFPLKKISIDETGEQIEDINREKYEPFKDSSRYVEPFDVFFYSKDRNEMMSKTMTLEFAGVENGIKMKLKFEHSSNEWFLVEYTNESN